MRLLALADAYIPADCMTEGLASLAEHDIQVEVRSWTHDSLEELQEANLRLEQDGPDAVTLDAALTTGLEDVDMLVVQFAPVGRQILDLTRNLKLIGVLRTGTENVDVATATQRGVTILNTPARNARAVAECTVGLILAEVRNLARAHSGLVRGDWRRDFPNRDAIPELFGKRIGLIGLGAVGSIVAQLLSAFGSRILVYDPWRKDDETPYEHVTLEELLRRSDVVSLHARLTQESHHLIGATQLALMKPTSVLVNTARSGLIDQQALVAALRQKQIMGAALDVFDCEPLEPGHPLTRLDNVTLTPHLAGSTIDAFRDSPRRMAEQLIRLLSGDPDVSNVNHIPFGSTEKGDK